LETDLIYDVGLHNGNDTAYYLSQGYRVIGIEADSTLVDNARERFRQEIKDGRLKILNIAIGAEEGSGQFWVCDNMREWNSFDRAVASRMGMRHHSVDVECRPLSKVLQEHGVPYYLKVDIEKYDHLCVGAIDPADQPRYVSMEFDTLEDLISLRRAGYNAFKVIHQSPVFCFRQFRADTAAFPEKGHRGLADTALWHKPQIRLGPSGPFGENTHGEWDNFEETAYHLLSFLLGRSSHGNPPDWFIWFDIHATKLANIQPVRPLYD
jgi:FkbM family methyltransferase